MYFMYIYIYINIQTVYAIADTGGTTANYKCMIVNGVYDLGSYALHCLL